MTSVSACLVTRGDVDMSAIRESLTAAGIDDIVVWDNSKRENLAVFGRYAAIREAKGDLIWTQDDDCIVDSDGIRQTIARYPSAPYDANGAEGWPVLCNMPPEFKTNPFYKDHALVGFGAVFQRDAPAWAFLKFFSDEINAVTTMGSEPFFGRTCDIVFTGLTPRVLVDVSVKNLWWAEDETRMYRHSNHVHERQRMLDLVLQVRDAD